MLVEDETGVRELASEFLKAGGYTVLEAQNGDEALKCAMNCGETIQLLLTDMVMPRMSGIELASRLAKWKPELRVIFMTGYSEFSERNNETVPSEGALLQKPFSRATLLGKVREVLGATPCKHPSVTEV